VKTIYKVPLNNFVKIQKGARLLTAQLQGKAIVIWYECDKDAPLITRVLETVGTGWEMDEISGTYLATVQQNSFVWHIYDKGEL